MMTSRRFRHTTVYESAHVKKHIDFQWYFGDPPAPRNAPQKDLETNPNAIPNKLKAYKIGY